MLHLLKATTLAIIALLSYPGISANAQGYWVAYSQKVDVRKYEGHNFRLKGMVRADAIDDSAWYP
jgi:cytochrome c-type biogenesis protein CcmE